MASRQAFWLADTANEAEKSEDENKDSAKGKERAAF